MPERGTKQLNAKLSNLKKALLTTAPKRMGNDALRHFLMSFRNQGFTDERLVLWPKTKAPRTIGGRAVQGRILKGRGLLMNSLRVTRSDWNGIQLAAGGPQVPYAKIHNEGGTIETTANVRAHARRDHVARLRTGKVARTGGPVKAHTRRMLTYMPKRQYMGRSAVLVNTMRETILKTVVQTLVK